MLPLIITLAALENIQACPAPALANEESSDSHNHDDNDEGGESTSNKAGS